MTAKNSLPSRLITLPNRHHRLSHDHPDELIRICTLSGWLTDEMKATIYEASKQCLVYVQMVPPAPPGKVSPRIFNNELTKEQQINFACFSVGETRESLLKMVEAGNAYAEGTVMQHRDMKKAWKKLEERWICQHVQPEAVSGGNEYINETFKTAIRARCILFRPRPPLP